jgi:hypothetical protein
MCPVCGALSRINDDITVEINSMMRALNHKNAARAWLASKDVARR